MKTPATPATETPACLRDTAARAHDALSVSHQMQAMLREYMQLEAQHAARLRALALRMGDCVDRVRPANQTEEDDEETDEEDGEGDDELRTRQSQSQCVAVMDEVVTFLTRFASMHRHLSECLVSDLFDEWSDALAVQKKRMDAQEPELGVVQHDLKESEGNYRHAHTNFQTEFERACALYANLTNQNAGLDGPESKHQVARRVQDELAVLAASGVAAQRRTRSPSKAMQYVGSISKLLRSSTLRSDQRQSADGYEPSPALRQVAVAMLHAEHERQQCQRAYQATHRLHVRYKRLCDSLHQEYRCVHSECLASTRVSIRKLVIHVSAFTSNLQYDATQLFQHVERLHTNDNHSAHSQPTSFAPVLPVASSAAVPLPPLNVPLALEHVIRRRFPVVNERPKLLRHQNACHLLSV